MVQIVLGHSGKQEVPIDVDTLLTTRLLGTANSGGGKSFMLRRIAEQLFGHLPIFIGDRDGEFATLREKFPFVLIGAGGDLPATIETARVLAERLMEMRASVIIDLYEAFRGNPMGHRAYMRAFIGGVMEAPKPLWKPLAFFIDESHLLCPETPPKAANAEDREMIGGCKDAMILLATDGRKRGICPIWVTQRLAKLDKDASSEFKNRLVGGMIEDVDIDRATELMSVSSPDRAAFKQSLKDIAPGNFWGFGPAISKTRLLVKVGEVQTTHPEPGRASEVAPPPTPAKIRDILKALSDIPRVAEKRAENEEKLREQVKTLQAELKRHKMVGGEPAPKAVDHRWDELNAAHNKTIRALEEKNAEIATLQDIARDAKRDVATANARVAKVQKFLKPQYEALEALFSEIPSEAAGAGVVDRGPYEQWLAKAGRQGCRRMLETLLDKRELTRNQLATLAGMAPRSGTFKNYLSWLRTNGLAEVTIDSVKLIAV